MLTELEQVKQTFRNAGGFVDRAALFVGISIGSGSLIFGGLGLSGVGGVVAEGGTGGLFFGAGEEVITQTETDKGYDFGKVAAAGGKSAVIGAATAGVGYGVGRLFGRALKFLRGNGPKSVEEAIGTGLPKPKPRLKPKAQETAKHEPGAVESEIADDVTKPNEVVKGSVTSKEEFNNLPVEEQYKALAEALSEQVAMHSENVRFWPKIDKFFPGLWGGRAANSPLRIIK